MQRFIYLHFPSYLKNPFIFNIKLEPLYYKMSVRKHRFPSSLKNLKLKINLILIQREF